MKPNKSAQKSVPGRPFEDGFDPRRGRGPRKGARNAGRPPDAFKEMCRALASSAESEKAVREIIKDTTHPAFIGALKWATEHGYGKPRESLEVTGKDGKPIESQVWHFGAKKVVF